MKQFSKSLTLFVFSLTATHLSAQTMFTFDMRETSGGNYKISLDVANMQVKATKNGTQEFAYTYYSQQVNKESGVIGLSFDRNAEPYMRPNHSGHYFLIRNDAIFCSTEQAQKEYKFVPTNVAEYSKDYNAIISALSQELRATQPTTPPQPTTSPTDYSLPTLTFTVNGVSFKMIRVDGGTFTMGATPEQGKDAESFEKPAHQVTLDTYYIGETEVTQELWQTVMGSNPSKFKSKKMPVEKVSWNDCLDFIHKLNSLTGQNFHLPTEAQWEFAARGGTLSQKNKYAGGQSPYSVAWYKDNSRVTHPAATKSPNELGLYDMSGNVWEWCQDWYGSYNNKSETNPTGPQTGTSRVIRGGSWRGNMTSCRVSCRISIDPESHYYNDIGLRLAL